MDDLRPPSELTIINPTSDDLTYTYDVNEDGKPVSYTVKSRESGTFKRVVANHIAKHITTHILNQRNTYATPEQIKAIYDSLFI